MMGIRPAVFADFPRLQQIERAAGEAFRTVSMPEIAEDAPPNSEVLRRYADAGLAWVAADERDVPAAYLLADRVDNALHIEQVSVHPHYARQRLGCQLIEYAEKQAVGLSCCALTLTTFVDVPWNAPYYRRLGFREIHDNALTPGLAEVRRHEAKIGLDRWPRTAMLKPL